MDAFAKEKLERLEGADASRKGTIDSRIVDVAYQLNSFPQYCTTSSCSGRTIVFSGAESDGRKSAVKKGCQWHLVTHELLIEDELGKAVQHSKESVILKFEPFILHVRCHTLEAAQKLLALSIGAGCRNSGIMLSKTGKIHVAIRTTLSMEVPLSDKGNVLVTPTYLKFLTQQANEKMMENWKRLQRFAEALETLHLEIAETEKTQRPRKKPLAREKTKVASTPADYDETISRLFDMAT
uniref:tRNA wybutosine-synthesizing protein 3 homolog n=1 Tax=Amblyomma aureolatum TaxID=187763 RepID=A0A1E1XI22_9ACAR